ncbi:MAG: hypothetical protein ACE366_21000 [Bradymonadia bacterium]
MPLFDDQSQPLSGHYGFSALPVDELEATEYTLAVIAADVSISVGDFKDEIEACLKRAAQACRSHPRADNLMLRVLTFNSQLRELHGFKPVLDCPAGQYDGEIKIGGSTALYDAAFNATTSVIGYGERLADVDVACNAIVFVITDGEDNSSSATAAEIKAQISQARRAEALESLTTVLVGVNVNHQGLSQALGDFKKDAGFDAYLELNDATEDTLAALAGFIGRSISAQSMALGSGAASALLSF